MEDIESRISTIAQRAVESNSELFLVDVKVKGNVGNQKVLIFIDGDNGLNIDHCSKVSREVGKSVEEEGFMPGKFLLEVSSPGLDHPITLRRQYEKNVGRLLEVETVDNIKVKGELLNVADDFIILNTNAANRDMNFKDIKQSKILVSFK